MERYLKIAVEAALAAGESILKVYGTEDFGVLLKSDSSPLTLADEKSNSIINSFLEKTSIPIISEENKQIGYEERSGWDKCWIVDPLDGTKEFIKRNGEFTVNIALVENGKPLLGVIYVPVSKELYYADVARLEAYKVIASAGDETDNLLVKAQKLASVSNRDKSRVRVVGSRSHMNEDTLNFIEGLKREYSEAEIEIVSKGSSLKFCLVAEGEADIYPRFAPTMEWDTAAGQAICEAVGLAVVVKDTNVPMKYNKQDLLNSSFIVRNYTENGR